MHIRLFAPSEAEAGKGAAPDARSGGTLGG